MALLNYDARMRMCNFRLGVVRCDATARGRCRFRRWSDAYTRVGLLAATGTAMDTSVYFHMYED